MSTAAAPNERYRRIGPRTDFLSAAVGVFVAVAIHALVTVFALRAGSNEGAAAAVRRETPAREDEEIIEGALLRLGGGGAADPRRVIHREVPVRAQEVNRAFAGRSPNPDPNAPRVDAGVRVDPNSLLTNQQVRGRGNQDLAEAQAVERAQQRLAAALAAENAGQEGGTPGAPPGPGAPDGSVHGTETDPNRAGTGAWAKVQSYLQTRLRLLHGTTSGERRTFLLRISISADGSTVAGGEIVEGSGDATIDGDLRVQLEQLAQSRSPIPDLTDEERTAIAGQRRRVRYRPPE